jgi:serine-type D-Ala-D-Ala carboxypeptidase/endopeptidase
MSYPRWLVACVGLSVACATPRSSAPPSSEPTLEGEHSPPGASPGTPSGQTDPTSAGVVWATAEEHAELSPVVRPIVESHVGPARPWGGVPAVAVGVIRRGKQYFFGFGEARPERSVERTTRFEIGSITKTFVGLLLADAVLEGRVKLDDPANLHLPERLRVPSRNGKAVTLRHLATHRSGLPKMAGSPIGSSIDLLSGDAVILTRAELESWLSTATLEKDPGEAFEYSNLGAALLAFALEAREGRPWQDLVFDLITSPLGMTVTRPMDGTFVPEKAIGFDVLGGQQTHDGLVLGSAYAAAGGLTSSVEDMLRYAAVLARARPSPLEGIVTLAQRKHADGPGFPDNILGSFDMGLLVMRKGAGDVPDQGSHGGATSAFMSDVELAPQEGVAVVVLTNRLVIGAGRPPVTSMGEALLAELRASR